MTLILSQLTKNYVIQVSDRRLTYPDGKLYDDETNKAVFYNGHFTFAYTGLAKIDGKTKTDDWLVKILQKQSRNNFENVIDILRDEAEKAIKNNTIARKKDKRHAFVGVGWCNTSNNLIPLYINISNYQNEKGVWQNKISPNFTINIFSISQRTTQQLFVAGQPISKDLWKVIDRISRECVKRAVGPSELARLLAIALRKVAITNPSVGHSLMITVIPKSGVKEKIQIVGVGKPTKDQPTFLHIPIDNDRPVRYSPQIVMDALTVKSIQIKPEAS